MQTLSCVGRSGFHSRLGHLLLDQESSECDNG